MQLVSEWHVSLRNAHIGHHEMIKEGLEEIECDHTTDEAWYANSTLRKNYKDRALAKLGEYFRMVKCNVTPLTT